MTIAGHAAHLKELGLTPDMPEQLRKLQAEYDALTIERDGLRVDRDGLRAERNELQVERDKVVEANRKLAEFLKIQEQQLGEANNKARFVLQLERDYAAMRHDRDVWAHHAHRIRNEYQTFRQGIIHFVPHPAPPAKPRHVQYSIPQAAEPPAPVHVPGQLNGNSYS
ncbi:hypothetical protein CERSUDRAFT_92820 [Gelatoporia subvermispora B]|uniref:Uncharacterized protein n=1 Tax=Ceriporiopsis subvermispora (strain B) TaxID=914234 RepID=M2QP02_CERS8|nr:hypothetical protein CERSUDRAFT_92820 [Gelatoporia subvermispora B]